MIRVLIADDSAPFREGFALLVRAAAELELVGEASTSEDAVLSAARLQPDVVVMDLHMPEVGGVEATRRIVETSPHIRVLILSMLEDDDSVVAAMRSGASGYLVKGSSQAEIVRAVSAVASGQVIFAASVARRVVDHVAGGPPSVPFPQLTDREREVLDALARGHDNARIARDLGIAPKTVRNTLSVVFTKLGLADRSQAIVRAREGGLGR